MKLDYENREITRAFKRVFSSRDGEIVMKYLMDEYGLAPIDETNSMKMAAGVGARNLVMDIINILEREEVDNDVDIKTNV